MVQSDENARDDAQLPRTIPREFRKARRHFIGYAYANRLLSELALSLALGGILYGLALYVLTDSSLLTITGGHAYLRLLVPIAAVLFAVLFVPAVAVWRLSNDMEIAISLRWARRAALEKVLFFFLFDVRRLVTEVAQLDALLLKASGGDRALPETRIQRAIRRVRTSLDSVSLKVSGDDPAFPEKRIQKAIRKVRTSLVDLENRAHELAYYVEAPSGSFLLRDHCRLRRNRLLRKVHAYRSAARGVHSERGKRTAYDYEARSYDPKPPHPTGEFKEFKALRKARKSILNQVKDTLRVTEPAIAREALRVTTQVGTNNMIVALASALIRLGDDERGRKNAANLLKAVEVTRTGGGLIRDLLDLSADETWTEEKLDIHAAVRKIATGKVADNFATMLEGSLQGTPTEHRVTLATIGYSTTVAACLERAKNRVSAVLILQCDQQTGDADDAMLAELEEMGIEAEIVDVTANVAKRLEGVKVILFGFEAVSVQGDLAHRQGLEAVLHPIEHFINPNTADRAEKVEERTKPQGPAKPIKCAVGETWKVRDFEEKPGGNRKVPARLIYHVEPPYHIVTDCNAEDGVHKRDAGAKESMNLNCCRDAWKENLEAEARRRGDHHGDNGVEGAFRD